MLALPPGFGIAQVGPFFTYVQSSDAGATVVCFGDNNAETTGEYFVSLGGGFVGSLMLAPGVIDFAASDDGPAQDALGYPLRYTAAAGESAGARHRPATLSSGAAWRGISPASTAKGIFGPPSTTVARGISQQRFEHRPSEGMLGWDYHLHKLMAFGADNAWHAVGRPYG